MKYLLYFLCYFLGCTSKYLAIKKVILNFIILEKLKQCIMEKNISNYKISVHGKNFIIKGGLELETEQLIDKKL